MPLKILDLLPGAPKIADIVALALDVIIVACYLLQIFRILKDIPNSFNELLKQRFNELDANVESIKTMMHIAGRLDLCPHPETCTSFIPAVP